MLTGQFSPSHAAVGHLIGRPALERAVADEARVVLRGIEMASADRSALLSSSARPQLRGAGTQHHPMQRNHSAFDAVLRSSV